jgi:hypothetical protein
MKPMRLVCTTILASALVVTAAAQTISCPTPPNKVNVSIAAVAAFDPRQQLFTYSYTVSNGASSQQDIDSFNLDVEPSVSNVSSPLGWTPSQFMGRSTLGWTATLVSETGPDDGISIPPSIAQIKPRRALAGFSFQSLKPPGFVKYYVTGFSPEPVQPDEEAAERLAEACPQSTGNFFDLAVTGSTVGPTKAIPVLIDIEPGNYPKRIDREEQRIVPIAILGSANFDARTVDINSLQFGPGRASPTDKGAVFQDVNGDGIPDMVAHFSVPAIGLRCNDRSVFLVGKTLNGTAIGGADSVVVVDCE